MCRKTRAHGDQRWLSGTLSTGLSLLVLVLLLQPLWSATTIAAAWKRKRRRGEGGARTYQQQVGNPLENLLGTPLENLLVELGCPREMGTDDEARVPPLLQVTIRFFLKFWRVPCSMLNIAVLDNRIKVFLSLGRYPLQC